MSNPQAPSKQRLWQTSVGAWVTSRGVAFRLWAPKPAHVELIWEKPTPQAVALQKGENGFYTGEVPGMRAGDRYRYRLDGQGPFPDPASRFQPAGIHGPSMVVDAQRFTWSDEEWTGVAAERRVIYELHIGTFTPEGTFAAAAEKLQYLVDLGVTVVEVMPVADFPGQRNWGYDGVFLYAPARCYGTPGDLRRFVDEAHRVGLAVVMDVVYNHFGPDGNYTGLYSPSYFTSKHRSPWGDGLNFDGKNNRPVREFFLQNALHWIHEYHIDGLRLDATHAIVDDSQPHFVAELTAAVQSARETPRPFVIAEDHRNLTSMIQSTSQGGWGLDGVWADDFHHVMRRLLAGDHESYYQDFQPSVADLAKSLRQGWLYTGQHSAFMDHARGTDPSAIPYARFVLFIQNHDQVGNRAMGERLHQQIDPAAYRAASLLFLVAPETPMLFMGQEFASTSPFQFFTDHNQELGMKVTEGRREEFKTFSSFASPEVRARIPDPQAESTFTNSRLKWSDLEEASGQFTLALYRAVLKLRAGNEALRNTSREQFRVEAVGEDGIALSRGGADRILALVRLRGAGELSISREEWSLGDSEWGRVLSTEDDGLAPDPKPIKTNEASLTAQFQRPGAVIWRRHPRG